MTKKTRSYAKCINCDYTAQTVPYLTRDELATLKFEHSILDDEISDGFNLILVHPKSGIPILALTADFDFHDEETEVDPSWKNVYSWFSDHKENCKLHLTHSQRSQIARWCCGDNYDLQQIIGHAFDLQFSMEI